MQPVRPETLLENLSWRYATKKFDPTKKIAPELWATLEKAAILAPTSYGLQPWKLVEVTNAELRTKLRAVSWNQSQITDASHLIVFCRKTSMTAADVERYLKRIVEVRGVSRESLDGYGKMMIGHVAAPGFDASTWAAKQTYIALGFFLAACAELGVDACPMEGFDSGKYDEILGLPAQGYSATVVATAGYRASDDPTAAYKKVRFEVKDMVDRR